MPIEAVLFDAVGTLIFPDPPVARAYCQAGSRFGSLLAEAQIRERFRAALQRHHPLDSGATDEAHERRRWRLVVADVFDDVADSDALFEALWQHFADPAYWRLFPDVLPAWEALRKSGLQLGLASNFDQRLVEICRQLTPLNEAEWLFCSSQVGYAKPSPSFFAAVQESLGLPAERILLVGDDPQRDYRAARLAGWHAALVARDSTVNLEGCQPLRSLLQVEALVAHTS